MAAQYPQRMSGGQRLAVLLIFGALWLSGCYWLLLHYFFAQPSDFGPTPASLGTDRTADSRLDCCGCRISPGLALRPTCQRRWPQMIKRLSGIGMAAVAAILALTGYALYYTTDRLHDVAGCRPRASLAGRQFCSPWLIGGPTGGRGVPGLLPG